MTTIAWDGTTLAGDKRATAGTVHHTITKVRRGETGNLVGYAGNCALGEQVFAWLCEGGERPDGQFDKNDFCQVIEITPEGHCLKHERYGSFRIEDPFFAVGSGADFALMAMACGKTAVEAVQLTGRFDTNTGNGIDVLTLEPVKRSRRRKARWEP
jgi:hypothetical protein